ncbi:hypothetical protein COY32_00220 [candidate division WWE3 bacterium CG_4_10_14_0_2_um_filter_41_14]|uniref:Radical SAM core domain-containing protein n=1 Tax=candidate division WWE3 bacterium CG_4_10_14_0_2_um_filter_41_14 TaxID=1975072 RepID=A0A2M7TLZ9_UNCKA|nr:MAG: hypothetical protein COY32_00220 [candidate division WWE3 bacterium CG_4_10_14_0_2_um_filter_41_14]
MSEYQKNGVLGFGRASYEITEACNYHCQHCLLAHRHRTGLSLTDRYKLLDWLADAGCLWLQITGGEPTVDKYFIETYRYAYEKGFLISLSTNGSRLSKKEIRNLLAEMPPYRIAISMYGGTLDSFEALTQDTNGYGDFLEGLHTAQELRLNVRINIIRTRYNQYELGCMQQLAESYGFSHHTYSELLPTLSGDSSPIYVMAECELGNNESNRDNIPQGVNWLERCGAGRLFFHVDCKGDVSICQSARSHKVNLLGHGLDALASLQQFSEVLLETPAACTTCSLLSHCLNCPPKLALYRNVGQIPDYVCRFQS